MSRPTRAVISRAALRHNFAVVRDAVGPHVRILPVVKANAYGHGAVECARILMQAGADAFGIAIVEEALELRALGGRFADVPLIILGPFFHHEAGRIIEHRLVPLLADAASVTALEEEAARRKTKAEAHLAFDTGMGRLGVAPDTADATALIEAATRAQHLAVTGVFTHLAHADDGAEDARAFTQSQIQKFMAVAARVRAQFPKQRIAAHVLNSAGSILHRDASWPRDLVAPGDIVRPGLMMYGVSPLNYGPPPTLHPALRWETEVASVRTVPAGTPLSYKRTFITERTARIALLPVGYADGYPRRASGRAQVLIFGRRAPVAGLVTMDLMLADVTDIPGVERGTPVTLLGRDGGDEIAADEIARWAETISYEILTRIGPRVPRVYVDE